MNPCSGDSKVNSVSSPSPSIDYEDSSSNFSLSKTRKIQRRTNKKKITKIVHTYCFYQIGKDGQREPFYCQQIGESALKDPQSVKNLALRQLNEHSFRMIETAKKSTGFTDKEPNETMVKFEADPVLSAPQLFQPAQFYFIF